mgnify:CR=1 FL=1
MPRTIAQAEALEQLGIEIDKVVNLLVEDSTIEARMAGRRVCAKCGASYHIKNKPSKVEGVCDRCGGELVIRKDDRPETVRDRLVTYHQQTEPLVDFYRKRGKLVDIPDQGSIEATNAYILKQLERKRSMIQIKNAAELEKMRKAAAISAADIEVQAAKQSNRV